MCHGMKLGCERISSKDDIVKSPIFIAQILTLTLTCKVAAIEPIFLHDFLASDDIPSFGYSLKGSVDNVPTKSGHRDSVIPVY